MKKAIKSGVSLIIAVVMCLSLLPITALAADTPSTWAQADVNKAIAANLVPQALQSQYTQVITRAEFTALAVALYETVTGKAITERTKFNDTTDTNVEKAAAIGVVSGVGNNNFSPNTGLTREQAATMLSRLAYSVGKPLTKQAATFADNGSISSWALEAVGQIQAAGVMSGVGNNTFAPKNDYTREQSIMTVLRLYDVVKDAIKPESTPEANTITLQVGLKADIITALGFTPPSNTLATAVSWTSSNKSVAYIESVIGTVGETSVLVTVSAGTTQIECISGREVLYSVVLTVEGERQPEQSAELEPRIGYFEIPIQGTSKYKMADMNWTSSNPGVAYVNTSNLVIAVAPGTTILTGTLSDVTLNIITVTVLPEPEPIPEYSADNDPLYHTQTIRVGESSRLQWGVIPPDSNMVMAQNEKNDIALHSGVIEYIHKTGHIVGIAPGTVTIEFLDMQSIIGRMLFVTVTVVE